MIGNSTFYYGLVRKAVVAFGAVFSGIYIERKKDDSVKGTTIQRIKVPLSYAPREKWLSAISENPDQTGNTYTSLPRISFELTGYNYDPSRKFTKMQKVLTKTSASSVNTYSPTPYNLELTLYILTKNQEDAFQIIEQILPVFNPEYTLSINAVDNLEVVQDIPVALNSISISDDYEGDYNTRRFVTHTLTFTLKLNLYGGINNSKVITKATSNVATIAAEAEPNPVYVATGVLSTGAIDDNWIQDL